MTTYYVYRYTLVISFCGKTVVEDDLDQLAAVITAAKLTEETGVTHFVGKNKLKL
jgi:hypothetical protein